MSVLSKGAWIIAGGVTLSVGFSAFAAGGLTWAAAGAGLQNAGWAAGHGIDIVGTVGEFAFGVAEWGGESLVEFTSSPA